MAGQQALDARLGGARRRVLHLAQAHKLAPHVAPRVDHLHLGVAEQVVRARVRVRDRVRFRVMVP